jgi:Trypsin-like serine proteases, typically periplasmic, contain C-terminal PDZ domain
MIDNEHDVYDFPVFSPPSASGLVESAAGTTDNPSVAAQSMVQEPVLSSDYPNYPAQPGSNAAPAAPQRGKRRHRVLFIFLLAILLGGVFGIGLFSGWVYADQGTSTSSLVTNEVTSTQSSSASISSEAQQEAAIARVEPAVVELDVTTSSGEAIGSGEIIDAQGDIVTNNHVVSGAQTITAVLNTGKTEQAQLMGTNAADDLAVVRIQPFSQMAHISIASSTQLTVGESVLAIGNPLGITETVTDGIVSALHRSVAESSSVTLTNAIQTSAAVNPGNSGGALIDLQGNFIGIPTLTAINTESNTTANGISFAIPATVVANAVQKIVH